MLTPRSLVPGLVTLVCALAATIPSLPAHSATRPDSRPDLPSKMKGVIRYKSRGPLVVPNGFLTGFLAGPAAAVGQGRIMRNFARLLSLAAAGKAPLGGNASMGDVQKFMAAGDNINLAGLPTSGHYDAEVAFVLEDDGKGVYRVQGGSVKWNAGNRASLELSSADGNWHKFDDEFHGEGSAPLEPESILFDNSGRRAKFEVNVNHPLPIEGRTVWIGLAGHFKVEREDRAGFSTTTANILGMPSPPEREENSPAYGGFAYSREGGGDSVLSSREMWTDAFGSSVLVEYELYADCKVEVLTPKKQEELVFDDGKPGRIRRIATAKMTPRFWSNGLKWTLPDVTGTERMPPPPEAVGDSFPFSYAKLPLENETFDRHELPVTVTSERARSAGCVDPEPHEVGFYFDRAAANNPGKARPAPRYRSRSKGSDPNWFYYWKQTAAAQGHTADLRYDGACLREAVKDETGKETGDTAVELGYYIDGDEFVTVCDLGQVGFSRPPADFLPAQRRTGIDAFAVTVTHEWKHLTNYRDYTRFRSYSNPDADQDLLPDDREAQIPVPKVLTARTARFKAGNRPVPTTFVAGDPDTFLTGFHDEHALAYAAEATWPIGSADKEDWACPGHQPLTDKCREKGR